jgi:hypothetical protein
MAPASEEGDLDPLVEARRRCHAAGVRRDLGDDRELELLGNVAIEITSSVDLDSRREEC